MDKKISAQFYTPGNISKKLRSIQKAEVLATQETMLKEQSWYHKTLYCKCRKGVGGDKKTNRLTRTFSGHSPCESIRTYHRYK